MKFLQFCNGKLQQKRKKQLKRKDIGFAELKITKVSIRSELFAFAWEQARVNMSRAFSHSQYVFTFLYTVSIRTDTQIKYGDSKYLCDNRISI